MSERAEDPVPIRAAVAYAIEVYRELSGENGAPSLGTQNQAVEFILADPALSAAVKEWSERARPDEATIAPPRRLSYDEAYRRIAAFMRSTMPPPVFTPANRG